MSSPFSPFKSQAVRIRVDYVRTPTKLLCIMYVHAAFRAWPFCSFVPCIPIGCTEYCVYHHCSIPVGEGRNIEGWVRRGMEQVRKMLLVGRGAFILVVGPKVK